MFKWKQPFLKIGFDGEFVFLLAFSKKSSPVLACVDALRKTHYSGLAGKLQCFVYSNAKLVIEISLVSFFFSKKTGKTILFPHGALTMPYQLICANAAYGALDADIM